MSKDKTPAKGADKEWSAGFRTGAKKGMTCDLCRCLVRQNPKDAEAHRRWHLSLESVRQT
jgi:hypothetical protein